MLEASVKHAIAASEMPAHALESMRRKYFVRDIDVEPRVYWRLTDNWLELTVRFLTEVHGVRDVKDQMAREVLARLDAAGIEIASATCEIVGPPPVRVSSAD